MPAIIGVHGIGQQFKGQDVLEAEWLPALRSGLRIAGIVLPQDSDLLACPFYGNLFRPGGTKAFSIPPYDAADISDDWEKEFLEAFWREAAEKEEGLPDPEAQTKVVRTPRFIQRALNALSGSRFFETVARTPGMGILPRRGRTYQPRATPWDWKFNRHQALKGRDTGTAMLRPFRAQVSTSDPIPGRCPDPYPC
jgi:hypothetical protein